MPQKYPLRRSSIHRVTLLILGLAPALSAAAGAGGLRLEPFVTSGRSERLVAMADPGDGSGRLFLVKQSGEILIYDGDEVLPTPFLDLSRTVNCCSGEQGLLDLVFHPDFPDENVFFVTYNERPRGDSVLARFSVSRDPDRADRDSGVELLRQPKPEPVHNVGNLEFGPDGYLYVGAGDGGVRDNGQEMQTFLGKILRLDVDRGTTYRIPPDNPFVGDPGAFDEIWAYGLRNPWRFSLDRRTGDLFVGDVGASSWEEVSFQPAGQGGANFGWALMEASTCTGSNPNCNADGDLTLPFFEYAHDPTTCSSVTGGYRYRGPSSPTLSDAYVFGDFCRGFYSAARRNRAGNWVVNRLLNTKTSPASFAEDAAGNLYAVLYGGTVLRLVGESLFADNFEGGDTSAWSRRRGGLEVVSPGLKRSDFALELPLGGDRTRRYLSSRQPNGESTFRASFLLKIDRARLGDAEVPILHLQGAGSTVHTTLTVSQEGDLYFLNLKTRDGGPPVVHGRTTLPRARPVRIKLDWLRASAPGRGDGQVLVFKNGKVRIEATGLNNPGTVVNEVRLGLVSGSIGARGGSLLIDKYASSP